jgi:hypothetical protein
VSIHHSKKLPLQLYQFSWFYFGGKSLTNERNSFINGISARIYEGGNRAWRFRKKIGHMNQQWMTIGDDLYESRQRHGHQDTHQAHSQTQNRIPTVAARNAASSEVMQKVLAKKQKAMRRTRTMAQRSQAIRPNDRGCSRSVELRIIPNSSLPLGVPLRSTRPPVEGKKVCRDDSRCSITAKEMRD